MQDQLKALLSRKDKRSQIIANEDADKIYHTSDEFLDAITENINVSEGIYDCLDAHVLPTTAIEDEYVVVVLKVMSGELQYFYGGEYLIQQWSKKYKIFQAVHKNKPHNFYLHQQRFIYSLEGTDDECQYLYISNFYQPIYQKIKHPFFNSSNKDGIHDISLFIDPKQVLIVDSEQQTLLWGQLKIESLITSNPSFLNGDGGFVGKIPDSGAAAVTDELIEDPDNFGDAEQEYAPVTVEKFLVETNVEFKDVLKESVSEEIPEHIIKVHCVDSEGYMRKEVHFVVETAEKIYELGVTVEKRNMMMVFQVYNVFSFEKQFIDIGIADKIKAITLENYTDQENLIAIHMENQQLKIFSETIQEMMIEHAKNIKQEEEEESSDEEEKARIAALMAERQKICYRITHMCRQHEPIPEPIKKNKKPNLLKNKALFAIKHFVEAQIKRNYFHVTRFFMRRQNLYFMGKDYLDTLEDNNDQAMADELNKSSKNQRNQTTVTSGLNTSIKSTSGNPFKNLGGQEIRRVNINLVQNADATNKASKLNYPLKVALLQDVILHVNIFNDFLIANTTLIISHQKVLSIYDFLTQTWRHMLPQEQGNLEQQVGQTYFGIPDDEIDQLVLNCIYSNTIFDCIIKYKGQFIRRLKYYNNLDKQYFEKGKIFENQKVLQIQRIVDTRNYRQYGDSTVRTLFLIEDTQNNQYQIWVSENGSRITKLIDKIPTNDQWQLVDIPNARSDMLAVYSKAQQKIQIYTITNIKQCLYPREMAKYLNGVISNIDYDVLHKQQYFLFNEKLYYHQGGDLKILHMASKTNRIDEINFNGNIKDMFMTHEESIYYKDKTNVLRFAHLGIQNEFDVDKLPTQVKNCRGAFCTKIEYSITTNRIALFTSSFEISIIPLLDRCRLDLIASQEYEDNFICWKEIGNKLIALKKPNILITWNTDTGKIEGYHVLENIDYDNYKRHTEWNGATLMKMVKQAKNLVEEKQERFKDMQESDESFDLDDELQERKAEEEKLLMHADSRHHMYSLIEIISSTEIKEHCKFMYEFEPGMYLYVSYPYMLVMNETCTKMYLLEGKQLYKQMRLLNTFFEPQMKIGKPSYFSPNFHHRIFIEPLTKEVVINFTLTNSNICNLNIRKLLMFQLEKTHPMIYFHDNDKIIFVTIHGVEKIFKIEKILGTRKRKGTCKLVEISNIYYSGEAFLRRFFMDPQSFNLQQASQMTKIDILRFRSEIIKRNLQLNVYQKANTEVEEKAIPRFYVDKNISSFTHFIINNYRQELTFSYMIWKVIESLSSKKVAIRDFKPEFIQELAFTVLPGNQNILHAISNSYDSLDQFISYVKNENIEEDAQQDITISDILFLPDLYGKTPLHYAIETNNTRVIDRLIRGIGDTDFDHHNRFILDIYAKLIEIVPQSMSDYLQHRMMTPPWIKHYTRGRIEPENDCDFVMTADQMWKEDLDASLQGKLFNEEALEVPLEMQIMDLPHLHKYENQHADDFLEALAATECIEIFSNNAVKALVELKWPLVREAIKKFLFYPYLVFLLVFLIYSVSVFEHFHARYLRDNPPVNSTADSNSTLANATSANTTLFYFEKYALGKPSGDGNEEGGEEITNSNQTNHTFTYDDMMSSRFWADHTMEISKTIILLFTAYFFLVEARQMFLAGPLKYLASPWNYLDQIPLALISASMFFRSLDVDPKYERPLNAIASFFMWIKFLYFWRIFRQTSKFISMIVAIIADLQVFLVVFVVTLIAFGQSMYIMSNNNDEENQFIGSLTDSLFFAYKMALGDFDTSELGTTYKTLVLSMFVLSTLFLTIMMLNILIAVISDSYARVESTSIEEMYKNMADLIAENEYLVRSKFLKAHDEQGDYLYIAKIDTTETEGEMGEELKGIQSNIIKKTETIERMLRDAQRSLVNSVHSQTESYTQYFKDANLKYELRMKQFMRKAEALLKRDHSRHTSSIEKKKEVRSSLKDEFQEMQDEQEIEQKRKPSGRIVYGQRRKTQTPKGPKEEDE